MVDLTVLFQALILLISCIITYFVVPWIKEKRADIRDERIRKAVDAGCRWAEQTLKDHTGYSKRIAVTEYVEKWLQARGYTYDAEEIRMLLEATVFDINNKPNVTVDVSAATKDVQ